VARLRRPVLVRLAALALVFSALGAEQAAALEGLPSTPLIEQGPAVAPYNPPALSSPSDRVIQSDQSFQFNRGRRHTIPPTATSTCASSSTSSRGTRLSGMPPALPPERQKSSPSPFFTALAGAFDQLLRGCLTEKIAGKNRRTLSHEEICL